jgi:hypothetical protein
MKLKTKIEHSFDVDPEEMEGMDFSVDVSKPKEKPKTKIVTVKRTNIKKDVSTRLF